MKELSKLFVAFGLVVGLLSLWLRFFAYETRVDYGYTPPPSPEARQADGQGDPSLKVVAPELFE